MKVYVMTKAKPFEAEQYMGVKATKKAAEKALREVFPHMRKDVGGESYISSKDNAWLLFIREEEV